MTKDDAEWIEQFYSDWEKGTGEVRPKDYVKRALSVIYGTRNPYVDVYRKGTKNED